MSAPPVSDLSPFAAPPPPHHSPPFVTVLQEDKDEIINGMRSETKALGLIDTSENCWDTFISKVKANLHMVFTASPVGENFRVRSQRFLATVTSTVIDWCGPTPPFLNPTVSILFAIMHVCDLVGVL